MADWTDTPGPIPDEGYGENNPRLKFLADSIARACGEDVPVAFRYEAARVANEIAQHGHHRQVLLSKGHHPLCDAVLHSASGAPCNLNCELTEEAR